LGALRRAPQPSRPQRRGLDDAAGNEKHHQGDRDAVHHKTQMMPRRNSGRTVGRKAPHTGPISVPIPPTMTMARMVKDSVMKNASGTSVPTRLA
jgi:hypothetical protein